MITAEARFSTGQQIHMTSLCEIEYATAREGWWRNGVMRLVQRYLNMIENCFSFETKDCTVAVASKRRGPRSRSGAAHMDVG